MKTKSILAFIFTAITAFALLSCEEGPDKTEVTYTISADKTTAMVDEEVTFTITSSEGEDVTADWNICDETSLRTGSKFGWSTPGKHTVTGHSKADPSVKTKNTLEIEVTASGNLEVTYTISADKTTAEIDEEVTFTITSSEGEDVTADWNICDETACRTGFKFGWSTPGKHTVNGHSKADPSVETENTLEIEVTGSIYKLSADKTTINRGESVTFTITEIRDGEELDNKVTGFSIGLKDGERFSGPTHAFNETGVFTVDAYQTNYKGDIIRTAYNTLLIIVNDKPVSGYSDRFYRRSILFEGTGTACNSCPKMAAAIETIQETPAGDRFIPLAIHMWDDAFGFTGNEGIGYWFWKMNQDFSFYSYPFYCIDWNGNFTGKSDMQSTEKFVEEISHALEAALASYDKAPGIAISSTVNGSTLDLTIKTKAYEAGEYMLSAVFVEDGIETVQSGGKDGKMVQLNVAMFSITDGPDTEYGITDIGSLEAGEENISTFKVEIPKKHNLANCRIVTYVCKKDESILPYGRFCANAMTAAVGATTDYEYEPIYEE